MSILYGTDQFPPTTPSRLIWPKSPPSTINTLINNVINADKNGPLSHQINTLINNVINADKSGGPLSHQIYTLINNVINADKNGPLYHPMINVCVMK